MLPLSDTVDFVVGRLDFNGEQIDVLDLEKAIAMNAANDDERILATEVLS
jgi:hypothetical protein